ncbi:hypothetical protein [Sediminimonas sp.]|uniref:hypothetical protein n=1 Tax=Sediminimonas sp. TaxID=2823379 RepID=UPI0025DD0BDE|nr:hypothetical protein [Sediminimonas sp.]
MKPEQIISDESVEEVHANANFESMTKREVVNVGVVQSVLGFSMGHTMHQIILEHGLVKKSSGVCPKLTAKGQRYLHAIIGNRASEIISYIAEGDQST